MANSFTIQIKGLDKVQQIFKDLPNGVQREIRDVFRATGKQWSEEARADAPANYGRLRTAIVADSQGLSLEIVAQTSYAGYQEFGTKSNAQVPTELTSYAAAMRGQGDNGGLSPLQALEQWVKRKGLAATYSVKTRRRTRSKNEAALTKQIAFMVWRKIKRQGVRAQSYLFSSKGSPGSGDRMTKFINQLRQNIAAALQKAL